MATTVSCALGCRPLTCAMCFRIPIPSATSLTSVHRQRQSTPPFLTAIRAARATPPATSRPKGMYTPASNFRCPAAAFAASPLLISGRILRSFMKFAQSAVAIFRLARPAAISARARAARDWRSWRATCVALLPLTARSHSYALVSSRPEWLLAKRLRLRRAWYKSACRLRAPWSDSSATRAVLKVSLSENAFLAPSLRAFLYDFRL